MENKWKYIEGSLDDKRMVDLVKLSIVDNSFIIDTMNLLKIRMMLNYEGFNPADYEVVENPIEGVYICQRVDGENYFSIHDNNGVLEPTYTTKEFDENGCNCFPCETIHESILKMEI